MHMGEYGLWWSLEGHRGPINCLTFMEDGTHIASGGDDGHVIVWAAEDGSVRRRLKPKQGPVVALRWLRDDSRDVCYLMSAGANGTLVIWRFTIGSGTFEWLHMETVFDTAIEFVELDHTHNLLLLTTQGRIVLYQIQRKNAAVALRLVQAHPPLSHPRLPALPISAHFVQQAHGVIVAFLDSRELIAWNIMPWYQVFHHKLRTRIGSTAYHEGNKTLLVWNLVDGIDVYQLMDCSPYSLNYVRHLQIRVRQNRICHVQFDSDGKKAITGGDNGQVLIWDVSSGQVVQALCHGEELHAVQVVCYHSSQFSKHLIASGSSDAASKKVLLRVWSTEGKIPRAGSESVPIEATASRSGPLHLRYLVDFFLMVVISILLVVGTRYYYT
ncbi:WD40-repeat-containing domain protein [Pisolithus croceorrhizus]|nr:WD40-repeat-containing domain protein [Pisolithus croceorrhizus]